MTGRPSESGKPLKRGDLLPFRRLSGQGFARIQHFKLKGHDKSESPETCAARSRQPVAVKLNAPPWLVTAPNACERRSDPETKREFMMNANESQPRDGLGDAALHSMSNFDQRTIRPTCYKTLSP